MTTLTDGAAILAAIIADPDDDLPRLAYADRCEENGDEARAEFVRVQLRLAAHARFIRRPVKSPAPFPPEYLLFSERKGLAEREKQLLSSVAVPWVSGWDVCLVPALFGASPHRVVLFRRGLVESVRCFSLAAWHDHGPALAKAHPLARVEITDREPTAQYQHLYADGYGWWDAGRSSHAGDRDELPGELWRLLPPPAFEDVGWKLYRGRDAAVGALSAACIAWARAQP